MITQFPEVITIDGFVYKKVAPRASGGAFYDSKDNPSEITSRSVCLCPNGELTYSWRGVEQKWDKSYRVVELQPCKYNFIWDKITSFRAYALGLVFSKKEK